MIPACPALPEFFFREFFLLLEFYHSINSVFAVLPRMSIKKPLNSFILPSSSHHESGLKMTTFRNLLMLESFYITWWRTLRVMFSGCFL